MVLMVAHLGILKCKVFESREIELHSKWAKGRFRVRIAPPTIYPVESGLQVIEKNLRREEREVTESESARW